MHRGRLKMLGKDQVTQGMCEYSSCKSESEKILKDAEKEKHEGIQGQRQQESLAKKHLEREKGSAETDCTPKMIKY